MEAMTVLSQAQFESAVRITTPAEAAAALRSYPHFRTLGDVLKSFSTDGQIRDRMVDGFLLWFPESRRDSQDKKARNWLGGKRQSLTKEDAFILSHILNLTLDKTNELLKMTAGEGIHWRDPEDIIWSYSILHHLEPSRIRSLLEQAGELFRTPDAAAPDVPPSYTAQVFEKLQPVLWGTAEDVLAFIAAERQTLGVFHNTAHHIFTQYMELLEQGFSDGDVEAEFPEMTKRDKRKLNAHPEMVGHTVMYQPKSMSARDILETYLYRSIVPARAEKADRTTDPLPAIRSCIQQSWPDDTTLSLMKNRRIDVTRKVLILLFLATDGSNSDYAEADDEDLLTKEDAFLDVHTRLNLMLQSCGFLKLDPRNAFDWMILYCISSGDLWESDSRLQAMLVELFPEAS